MSFDPTSLSNFMLFLAAWGGAFIAALWLSLVIWTYRDIRRRARDPLARILAVLVVAVLFLPGSRDLPDPAPAAYAGRGIPAHPGRRSAAAIDRREHAVPWLQPADQGKLDRSARTAIPS